MSAGWALVLVAVLIAANGMFVAFEFGLVASRQGVLEEQAAAGDRRAIVAVRQLKQLSFVLSAAQFGITATSLVVGFLAEDALGATVVAPVLEALGVGEAGRTGIALAIAFTLSTVLQMLLGELAPKNYALAVPERTARALAVPMRLFGVVFGPVIRLFDGSAAFLTRRVFKTEVAEERLGGHSPEELARIILASREGGALTAEQGELLSRAVQLGDTRVHEIMVPRTRVAFLDADDTLDDLRAASRRTGHSRFPVRGADDDDVVGTVHIKDVLSVPPGDRAATRLGGIAAPAVLVPESEPLRRLLGRLRRSQRTFALAIDEYGGVAGIVTVEDVVEELVGEIEDEFDRGVGAVRRVGPNRWLLDGTVRLDQVEGLLGDELPRGDYETIAGFVIDQLGRIPPTGATATVGDWAFVAQRVEGVRLAQVLVRPADPAVGTGPTQPDPAGPDATHPADPTDPVAEGSS